MQAVILAAGKGSRLGEVSEDRPKCLQPVGGRTILEIQLQILADLGIEEVCVVAGFKIGLVKEILERRNRSLILENERFAETNSLYSLWLARDWIRSSFLCINGDVVGHPKIYRCVVEAPGCALAYDSGSGKDPEHMKVHLFHSRLRSVGKDLPGPEVDGENVGILKFEGAGTKAMLEEADRVIGRREWMQWVPSALNGIAASHPVHCVDIAGLPWVEVDFPGDLEIARNRVWPAVRAQLLNGKTRPEASCRRLDLPA
ncbi:MAG: NTP transferase domain-containing protein [Planctomycetota bacterium]